MVDVTDVRLVDAHAEGDRGHDDHAIRGHERVLDRIAILGFHARMVRAGVEPMPAQAVGHFFGGALQRDVDDRGARRPLLEAREQEIVSCRRLARRDVKPQVRR